jgi:hypothetical protein
MLTILALILSVAVAFTIVLVVFIVAFADHDSGLVDEPETRLDDSDDAVVVYSTFIED